MKRPHVVSGILLLASLVPIPAPAVPGPSTLTIRSGYVAAENFTGDTHPMVISLSSSWDLGKQTALWSSIGYVRESSAGYTIRPLLRSGVFSGAPVRTHLIPISAGLRAYANDPRHRSRGLFVEAGPSLVAAAFRGSDGANHPAALGGLQCGMGARFAGMNGSRFELGASYQLAEAIGTYPGALGRIGTPHEIDYHLFSVYLGVGIGN